MSAGGMEGEDQNYSGINGIRLEWERVIDMSDRGAVALFCGGAALVAIIVYSVLIGRWRATHAGMPLRLGARGNLKAALIGLLFAPLAQMMVLWLMGAVRHVPAAAVWTSPWNWITVMLIGVVWYIAALLYYLLAPYWKEQKQERRQGQECGR